MQIKTQLKKALKNILRIWPVYPMISPWRNCYFVDCGGNNGCSVRKFRNEYDPLGLFRIYTFEPNPQYESMYENISKHQLVKAAVDSQEGERLFYVDVENGHGSTFFKNKLTREEGGYGVLNREQPLRVRTVNLSNWLKEHATSRDYVVLKLDVEGAEYDILESLVKTGAIKLIDRLFVEWHWQKISIPKERHDRVIESLNSHRIPIEEWDAIGY